MEPCAATPGMMFHILHRAHANAVQANISAAGLADLGSPLILLLLRDWDQSRGAPAQRDLADAFHVTPATMAMSLKTLERGGYVEKTTDRQDQRCKRVAITGKGRAAVDTCQHIFAWIDRQMLDGFTPEERAQLHAYQLRMLSNIQKVGGTLDNPCERMECQC